MSTRASAMDDKWFPDQVRLIRFELLTLSSSGLARVAQRWNAAQNQEANRARRSSTPWYPCR